MPFGAASILVVVFSHWLMTAITFDDGRSSPGVCPSWLTGPTPSPGSPRGTRDTELQGALGISNMSAGYNITATLVVSASAFTLFINDVINWRTKLEDEFREKDVGYQLQSASDSFTSPVC